MSKLTFPQLVDLDQIRQLLEAHYKITGMLSAILDLEENILVAVGWQDICTRFHRINPETSVRCRESDSYIRTHLGDCRDDYLDYRCKNGLQDVAVPIIIAGEHIATFFTGQFFYEDDKPDPEFFRAQAREFGFDEAEYMDALSRVQVCSREQVRSYMEYFRSLVQMMAEMGLRNLELSREVAVRTAAEMELKEAEAKVLKLNADLEERVRERTSQLVAANELLHSEMAERMRMFDELQLTQFCVDKASIGIYRISEEGNIIFANDLACRSLGYTAEELCAMSVFDIDPTFNLQRFQEHRRTLRADGSRTFETIHRRKDGSTFPVEISVNYLEYNGRGFTVSFARNISERKKAEKELLASTAKYQAIVDAFDGLIYICSQDYRIEFMNRKLIERTGRDAVGELCYKVLHDRDSVCPWCVNDRVFAGETVHWDMFSPKDNHWYHVINVPIHHADGRMSKHSMIFSINDRKLFEEQLKQKKQELEELNRTLRQRVKKEVAKNREKDIILIQQNRQAALGETLEHILHQWKQPLNTIGLLIQLLQAEHEKGALTDNYVNETVDKTMDLLTHMAQTAEVFMDYYKPEKDKKVFAIKETLEEALSFIEPEFRHRDIKEEIDIDPELNGYGYPKEFAQVLLIILTNARDAFRERRTEKPHLAIKAFSKGKRAVVCIADNAGGIPERAIGKVFDLYFTTKEATGGTGIGLYMARSIIEKRMNGSLTVTNVDGGARFRIEIGTPRRAA